MTISANSVWEARATADAANAGGGFFVTGATGTDFSQQNSPQYALTGLTSVGSGSVINTASAAADMVGNGLHVISGTNFTTGWFEIISVVVGVSITVDRAVTTGVGVSGVANIGGAISFGSTTANQTDDHVLEASAAGNIWYIKKGNYTWGGTVVISKAGTTILPIKFIGYNSTRGDNPTIESGNQPTINNPASTVQFGNSWWVQNITFTGVAGILAGVLSLTANSRIIECKLVNTQTSFAGSALICAGNTLVKKCDISCYRAQGMRVVTAPCHVIDSYFHDSVTHISHEGTAAGVTVIGCLFKYASSYHIFIATGMNGSSHIINNSFHGCNNIGTGIFVNGSGAGAYVWNNTFDNLATGYNYAGASQVSIYDDYNNFFNCTTNYTGTGLAAGAHDLAINPTFSMTDVTGTAGTTSGSVLTDGSKNFTTLGLVAGRDFIDLTGGTGITTGIYGITAVGTTTLTLDSAMGDNAVTDTAYRLVVGANFALGNNALVGVGYPGLFPSAYTTGFIDIGAVQKQTAGYRIKLRTLGT